MTVQFLLYTLALALIVIGAVFGLDRLCWLGVSMWLFSGYFVPLIAKQ